MSPHRPRARAPQRPSGVILAGGGATRFGGRPKGLEVVDGAAYLVEISAVDAKSRKSTVFLRWVAGFDGDNPIADEPDSGNDAK